MATSDKSKKKRVLKKPETVREKAQKQAAETDKKPTKTRKIKSSVGTASKSVGSKARKEYYLPLPDSKFGNWLNKRRSLIPGFLRNSWAELRQVTWPNRRETIHLTFAVIMFAIVFGSFIAGIDWVLDKLFREVILNI
jgi:preprotein translocase SecE subunit